MGMPDLEEVLDLIGKRVLITFNHTFDQREGKLLAVRGEAPREVLILDDDEDDPVGFRAIQAIKEVSRRELGP